MYMGFLLTLPFKFIKLVWENLKKKGFIERKGRGGGRWIPLK